MLTVNRPSSWKRGRDPDRLPMYIFYESCTVSSLAELQVVAIHAFILTVALQLFAVRTCFTCFPTFDFYGTLRCRGQKVSISLQVGVCMLMNLVLWLIRDNFN